MQRKTTWKNISFLVVAELLSIVHCKINIDTVSCVTNCSILHSIVYTTLPQVTFHERCNTKGPRSFPCKKEHSEVGKTDRAHFHCPVCSKTIFHRQHFIKHLKTHYTEPAQTATAERDECHGNVDSGEEEDVEGNQRSHHEDVAHSADETEAPGSEGSCNEGGHEEKRSKVTKCRRDNPTSKSCPFCL